MAGIASEIKSLFDLLMQYWHRPAGAIIAIIVSTSVAGSASLKLALPPVWVVVISVVTAISSVFVWLRTNRLPKTKKGKVGFIVSIHCSDQAEKLQVREDFIITLRQLLQGGQTGASFQFIETPDHIAVKVLDQDSAQSLRVQARAHFVLYGRVRERNIDGKSFHILDLDGLVGHGYITQKLSRQFSEEFRELLPKRVEIERENDLFAFEFTSQLTEVVARYVIGIAAALSGAADYAESLFRDTLDRLPKDQSDFPVYKKLRDRVPKRISEICEAKAAALLDAWRKDKNEQHIVQMGVELEKIEQQFRQRYRTILLFSLYYFLFSRDTRSAIEILQNCKNKILNDPIWRYNLGFLYAYDENLEASLRQYARVRNYSIEPGVLAQVEEFMCWILEEEPQKYQFYFFLGYLNWQIKEDLEQAIKDFRAFISMNGDTFARQKTLAESWLKQIETIQAKRKQASNG